MNKHKPKKTHKLHTHNHNPAGRPKHKPARDNDTFIYKREKKFKCSSCASPSCAFYKGKPFCSDCIKDIKYHNPIYVKGEPIICFKAKKKRNQYIKVKFRNKIKC